MDCSQRIFASRARVKIFGLTLGCVLFLWLLATAYRNDVWATVRTQVSEELSHVGLGQNGLLKVFPDDSASNPTTEAATSQDITELTSDSTSDESVSVEGTEASTSQDVDTSDTTNGESISVEAIETTSDSTSDAPPSPEDPVPTSTEASANDTNSTTVSTAPVSTATRPAVIAAATEPLTLNWMNDLVNDYEVYPYIVTDSNPPEKLAVPANKGREAMVYSSYLIDNYDNLPPYAIFTHGHRLAWHQPIDIVQMIGNLKVDVLEEVDYVSFRCSWVPSCPAELRPIEHDAIVWGEGQHLRETEDAIAKAWPTSFPGVDSPHTIAAPCCAQFAVTRKAMQRRSKEDYMRIREWSLVTDSDDQVSGRVLEKVWAFIMTDEAVHCPSPNTCACKYFGNCYQHEWPQPPEELGRLPDKR